MCTGAMLQQDTQKALQGSTEGFDTQRPSDVGHEGWDNPGRFRTSALVHAASVHLTYL